jgi:hypothetical protein
MGGWVGGWGWEYHIFIYRWVYQWGTVGVVGGWVGKVSKTKNKKLGGGPRKNKVLKQKNWDQGW